MVTLISSNLESMYFNLFDSSNNLYPWDTYENWTIEDIIKIANTFMKMIKEFINSLPDGTPIISNMPNIPEDSTQIPSVYSIHKFLNFFVTAYWNKVKIGGFGLAQIDDCVILIVLVRLIILLIRYNALTAFGISAIGIASGYLWYSAIIGTLFTFEGILYQNSLTFRLGKDSYEIRTILQGKMRSRSYQTRITNPIGLLAYTISNASIHNGHYIDPISMIITKIPLILPHIPVVRRWNLDVVQPYYYFLRKIMPLCIRIGMRLVNQVTALGSYAYITRVNKQYCPHLFRWHWTMLITFQFMASFYINFIKRMVGYSQFVLAPEILRIKEEYYMSSPQLEFRLECIRILIFALLIGQIICLMLGMFHALCGQYFYIPGLSINTRLHIGLRPDTTWSGGGAAWEDLDEKGKWFFLPKLWFGWFGRGTRTPSAFVRFIKWAIYRPIYKLARKIIRFVKKR